MKRLLWMAIAAILFLLFLTGCESWNTWLRERDFELAISNRMNTPIQVAIDGEWTATIASQDILNFKITKKYEDSWNTYSDGTAYSVTTSFAAKSQPANPTALPQMSKTKHATLTSDRVTTITFSPGDW